MGNKYVKPVIWRWIIMLIATLDTAIHGNVHGLRTMDENNFAPKPKGTIKTIEVPEDGDLVDCIDFYKQPAFEDPLLKDIQMKPSPDVIHAFNKSDSLLSKIIQNWQKYGVCPKGTVPIRRKWKNNDPFSGKTRNDDPSKHEYAVGKSPRDLYFGASAIFNLWNPHVYVPWELSISQLWLGSRIGTDEANTIEIGWIVYPELFNNSKATRLFTYWTHDNYQSTRCWNTDCGGFVQTNPTYALGMALSPISVVGENQYEMFVGVNMDFRSKNWWVTYQGTEVGYFRSDIFTRMTYAEEVHFGGEIVNDKIGGRHTSTNMGSGHFSRDGLGNACYIRNAKVWNRYGELENASLSPVITNSNCYDFNFGTPGTDWGTHFFFGGPGYSDGCR